jgi:hypothetical protein
MNWYKCAQKLEVVDNQSLKGRGKHYTDIGHDIYYEEQNKLLDTVNESYNVENPNILWIYSNGEIETKIETDESTGHRDLNAWGLSSHLDKLYTGRFSPSEKVITVLSPHEGVRQFKEIPSQLQYLLKLKFPEAKKIIRY